MKTPYPTAATKTTFVLSDSRRARLKSLAIARRTTVTVLLAEGADLVLEKYGRMADQSLLDERGRKAREMMRQGFFHGGALPSADEVVYGTRGTGVKQRKRSNQRPR
jgi:hypothetical protein